jgi:uncharacterized protein (TIGR03067 family)
MPINIVGTWRAVYSELNGEMTPVAHFSGIEISFTKDKFIIKVHGVLHHEGSYSIVEREGRPAEITYIYTKSTFYELNKPRAGIVQITGDTLKDCLGKVGGHVPSSFNTTQDSDHVMTIHQRHGTETGTGLPVSSSRAVSEW